MQCVICLNGDQVRTNFIYDHVAWTCLCLPMHARCLQEYGSRGCHICGAKPGWLDIDGYVFSRETYVFGREWTELLRSKREAELRGKRKERGGLIAAIKRFAPELPRPDDPNETLGILKLFTYFCMGMMCGQVVTALMGL